MNPSAKQDFWGFVYGFLGVLIFSLTLPATRMAITGGFDPVFVGLGRAVGAGGLSMVLLMATGQSLPSWKLFPRFAVVIAGVIIGFPLLSALAMHDAPASHGAVITGLLPLSTALFGACRAGERPSLAFWFLALLGSGLVVAFALMSGAGSIRFADWALLGAVAAAGLGYAEGAVLSRTCGSWQVICWALVFSLPILLPIVLYHAPSPGTTISFSGLLGFLYVSLFSMFLGFFAWYEGLALGGIARVGQLQLLQPFLTMLASTVLLGEHLTIITVGFAMAVIVCVALGKQTQIITT